MKSKYQYVLQENMYDCGVAALKTIFLQYGKIIKTSDIIKNNINQGLTALQIINASKKLGLIAKGVKTSINDINTTHFPCIAHLIKEKSYFHYIVIFNKNDNKKQMTILDPAFGIKILSYEEFNQMTTNIFIIFEKRKLIRSRDKRFKLFIKKIFLDKKSFVVKCVLMSIVFIILSLAFNYYLSYILNYSNVVSTIILISSIYFFISIAKNTIDYYRNKLIIRLNSKIDKELNKKLLNHIFYLPYNYYFNKSTGELATLIGDIDNFKGIISKICILLLVDILFVSIIIIFMGMFSFLYMLLFLFSFLVLVIIAKKYQYIFNNNYFRLRNNKIFSNSKLVEYLNSIESIKNLNIENNIISKVLDNSKQCIKEEYNYNSSHNNYLFINNMFIELFYIIIICIASIFTIINNYGINNIVLFSSVFYLFIGFVGNICETITSYKTYQLSVEKVLDVFDEQKEENSIPLIIDIKSIKYNNVNFSYDDKKILENINFEIKKNDHIFITGSSGIGKSTLIKLLLKYNNLINGNIEINNKDIRFIDTNTIRNNITYVSQNEKLFTDTLYNNLSIINISKEEINKVLDVCLLKETFKQKNINENYILEENGNNLSGGERKKLLIARALLKNSNMIIFDESFNEIDVESERKILNNIINLYPNLIIIMISHRKNNKDLFTKCYRLEKNVLKKEE